MQITWIYKITEVLGTVPPLIFFTNCYKTFTKYINVRKPLKTPLAVPTWDKDWDLHSIFTEDPKFSKKEMRVIQSNIYIYLYVRCILEVSRPRYHRRRDRPHPRNLTPPTQALQATTPGTWAINRVQVTTPCSDSHRSSGLTSTTL